MIYSLWVWKREEMNKKTERRLEVKIQSKIKKENFGKEGKRWIEMTNGEVRRHRMTKRMKRLWAIKT